MAKLSVKIDCNDDRVAHSASYVVRLLDGDDKKPLLSQSFTTYPIAEACARRLREALNIGNWYVAHATLSISTTKSTKTKTFGPVNAENVMEATPLLLTLMKDFDIASFAVSLTGENPK